MNASSNQTTFSMNKIINLKQVIDFTGLSRATIYNLLDPKSDYYDATFPKQVRLTTNRVGWAAFEINQWIDSKLAQR
ncbi:MULTISPECIES: AlpA family phage regulatory protein [Acinetobacter]|uniref:AlpA family phage regulatory protein n=1 Tax=Acinetobacter TaxID=469 RepID=UPI000A378708|nr:MULTISPECIES: AlpA family transcriptional regulator [Acinetobacter]MDV7644899.1 AlpA family transcriptional regulator [Acinetobacter baumannii]MDX8164401.1 AlpA family transcriptional regulator [Acinetobacter pittii]OTU19969.1 AlpA family transcriptional regulator [Acinetobacter pittii]HCA5188273.1 AlpA family transcriptional regulator [Acinetobacter baumannii]